MPESLVDTARKVWKYEGFMPLLARTLKFARFKFRRFYRSIFAEVIIFMLPKRYFDFNGATFEQFYHRKNYTWANERCVELPIVMDYIFNTPFTKIMEFGNVLSNYYPPIAGTVVIDKYEKGSGITNVDIVDFNPNEKFDLIVSVSTIEHVGYDTGEKQEVGKIAKAVHAMKEHLTSDGLLVMTTCIGYNPEMDTMIASEIWTHKGFLKRVDNHRWKEVGQSEAMGCEYDYPYEGANCIAVLEIKNE